MTIRNFFEEAVARTPKRTAFQYRVEGQLRSESYAEAATRVRQIAELTEDLDLVPRAQPAAILLDNSPRWMEIYLGVTGCGIPMVPIDPKLRSSEIGYMLKDAGAVAVFTDRRHLPVVEEIAPDLPHLKHLVLVDDTSERPPECHRLTCWNFEQALAERAVKSAAKGARFDREAALPDDVASVIYTSGTTGLPKGAMLTHANFCADTDGALQVITGIGHHDRFLIVLPLFHSFSFTANFIVPLRVGACMQFVATLRSVGEDLRIFSPTILIAVPLLIEKIYLRIQDGLRAKRIARLMLKMGLTRLVARGVRRSLGGKLRLMVSGGAPCSKDVLLGLRRLRLPVIEGYGLTETSPVVSLSRIEDARPGTIGYPLPNIEVRLADQDANGVGEIQVRGPIVMRGYHNNPQATAEAFDGDWLRTGDLASMDSDGYLTIRGRKKALIVNREGKNIYPEEVEMCIARDPNVLDVVVIGYHDQDETGEKVGAIVVPNLDDFAADGAATPPWEEIEQRMRQIVQQQCRRLADYKRPRKIEVRREPLERTSIQKVRRHVYQGQLDAH